ncbi:MAG: hypothetical protein LBS36_08865 [Oscillospiraceae bacterium]|jgi:hypothetical protein|nr:hypothetical protein [Oscillospiraceae bacterium]
MEHYPFRELFYVRPGSRDYDLPPDSYWNDDGYSDDEITLDKETFEENFYEKL